MEVYQPANATVNDLRKFHSDDYVTFLQHINVKNVNNDMKGLMKRFLIGANSRSRESAAIDCPIFDGLFGLIQMSTGGSLCSAIKINRGEADICINWAGGLHHAKKSEASGFCYVNDIVLCILELLKFHSRVLYVDIDCHHGDGVEEAFYTTNRVMTVSFHQYGDSFFPGTGNLNDIGAGKGRYYCVNVPMREGMSDENFERIFVPVMQKVMQVYDPKVVVLQCGSDSLTGDKLGELNLTFKGHGNCVNFMRNSNLPLILLGGGGYTIRNVSRCWAYETSIALNVDIPNELPYCNYYNYFDPDHKLHISADNTLIDLNTPKYIRKILEKVFENLKYIEAVPSAQFHEVPFPLLVNVEN